MSNTLLNNLSEAQIASLLNAVQQISGNEVSAEPAKQESAKPIHPKTGYFLVRLLNSKQYDSEAVVYSKQGEALLWSDDSQITFGDLATKSNVRPDGSEGTHYPNVFGLTQTEGSAAIDYLSGLPDKPKSNFRKAGKSNAAKPQRVDDDRLAKLEALVTALVQNAQPAKPVPAPGVEKVRSEAPKFNSGDVINVNGVDVQISEDGKRLNKTIVTK